jgi:hypothetical protein
MDRRRLPDPGGVFDFDDERHVLGHLRAPHDDGGGTHNPGAPLSLAEFVYHINQGGGSLLLGGDAGPAYTQDELHEILQDLEAQGDAARAGDGWVMTEQGFNKLTGPNGYEPPPMSEAQVKGMYNAGELNDEQVAAWKEAYDAYHGTAQ